MMLFRSAQISDLDAIYQLAQHSGIGITSLPKNKDLIRERLHLSCESFKKNVKNPSNEYYIFLLEEPSSSRIVGISAIIAFTGFNTPFYSYKLSKQSATCTELKMRRDYETLSLVNDYQGHSEVCTLFLEPEFRHKKNGSLLSRARFLYIAQYPNRFRPIIIAEIRGISDASGKSPFWDKLYRNFFSMSFSEAEHLSQETNKQFIADLIPKNPIHINLLAAEAQAVIGHPHQQSAPAKMLLVREGFQYHSYVDILDAGPTLEAWRERINTIASSRILKLKGLSTELHSKEFLLANPEPDFRATLGEAVVLSHQDACFLSNKTAELLQVKVGGLLRIAPLQTEPLFSITE